MIDKEFKLSYYKMLIALAFKKAEQYELEDNEEKVNYFLGLGEIAEKKLAQEIANNNHHS